MKQARPFLLAFLLLAVPPGDAHAQANPVRLKVSKMETDHRHTTYQSASGTYRQQQVNSAVYYTVEILGLNTTKPSDLKVKWAILVDPSHAEAQGAGYSWNNAPKKIVEGERQCKVAVGQRYAFDTDSIDLDTVTTDYDYDSRRYTHGGTIQGYLVEVYDGDRLVASDYSSTDIKREIEQTKEKRDKKNP